MKRPILLFCFILFFLCSCQSKKGDSLSLPLSELKPLTLGMMPTLEGLPFYIARSEGIYDSLGLDLTILPFNSANARDAVFQTGQMDGMVTDYPSAITLQAIHHTELGFIFKNDGYLCFIVSKESRINQPEQLIEKNIAVSRNTVVEYATDQLLNKAGIKYTETNKPEISQLPLRLQMLQYNQIDASFLPDPAASIAMNSKNKSLISTQELGIEFIATAFSRKALQEKRKEIELLITGYNLGVNHIKMHPQSEWKQVLMEIGVPENLTGLIALPTSESNTTFGRSHRKSNPVAESKSPDTPNVLGKQSDRHNLYSHSINHHSITTKLIPCEKHSYFQLSCYQACRVYKSPLLHKKKHH